MRLLHDFSLLRAMPDTLTATAFICLWMMPAWFGRDAIGNGMLTLLMEFFVIHATAALVVAYAAFAGKVGRGGTLVILAVIVIGYAVVVAMWSRKFGQWWPIAAFAWLMFAKVSAAISTRQAQDSVLPRLLFEWIASTLVFLFGALLTMIVPVPMLGIDAAALSGVDLPGKGLWSTEPHRPIAFAAIYFLAMAALKGLALGEAGNREEASG